MPHVARLRGAGPAATRRARPWGAPPSLPATGRHSAAGRLHPDEARPALDGGVLLALPASRGRTSRLCGVLPCGPSAGGARSRPGPHLGHPHLDRALGSPAGGHLACPCESPLMVVRAPVPTSPPTPTPAPASTPPLTPAPAPCTVPRMLHRCRCWRRSTSFPRPALLPPLCRGRGRVRRCRFRRRLRSATRAARRSVGGPLAVVHLLVARWLGSSRPRPLVSFSYYVVAFVVCFCSPYCRLWCSPAQLWGLAPTLLVGCSGLLAGRSGGVFFRRPITARMVALARWKGGKKK